MIRNLLQIDAADPRYKTELFDIYTGFRGAKTVPGEGNQRTQEMSYYIHITDYKGQNIGTLIKGLIQQQITPGSPIKLGYINSFELEKNLRDFSVYK